MNDNSRHFEEATENPNDSDSTIAWSEWISHLPPASRDALRKGRERSLETSVAQTQPSVGIEAALHRLERVESLLTSLVEREQIKDFYSTEEFARLVNKAEFTVREWCRLGRIKGEKKGSGRGKYQSWVVSHDELLRFRKEGLLPLKR